MDKTIFEKLKENDIEYVEEIWYQQSTKEYHVISKFPNGRIYNYYNALVKGSSLTGPFKDSAEAINALNDHRPYSKNVWKKSDEEITEKDLDLLYITHFHLSSPVLDYDAAKAYLLEDNMEEYAKNDKRIPDEDRKKIKKITWNLIDDDKGIIEVKAYDYISDKGLEQISEWISGQCSDGIGEGFEQRDFAEYYIDYDGNETHEPYTPYGEENELVNASFDWETNDYELVLQE